MFHMYILVIAYTFSNFRNSMRRKLNFITDNTILMSRKNKADGKCASFLKSKNIIVSLAKNYWYRSSWKIVVGDFLVLKLLVMRLFHMMDHICLVFSSKLHSCLVCTNNFPTALLKHWYLHYCTLKVFSAYKLITTTQWKMI